MVKLQDPVLLAVVVPSDVPPSDTVTVAPSGAVPFKVTASLVLTVSLLMTGAAGGDEALVTVTANGLDAALVPAEVVSVAVKV